MEDVEDVSIYDDKFMTRTNAWFIFVGFLTLNGVLPG